MYVGAGDHLDMAGNEQECAIVWHLTDRSGRGWTFQKAQINQSPESCLGSRSRGDAKFATSIEAEM